MVGQVKLWFPKQGYGFIKAGNIDYYVRFRDLSDDFLYMTGKKDMEIGETVSFTPKMWKRGPYATEVSTHEQIRN